MDFSVLNFYSIAPMLTLCVFGLFILCIGVFSELSTKFYTILTIIAIILDLGLIFNFNGNISGFFGMVLVDGIAIISVFIILIASMFFIPLALDNKKSHEYSMPEFFALFLFMLAGFEFMVSSTNLILIFVGLETSSLALYTLIAMHNRNKSVEAALKYFTMGALGSGFFAFGVAIFYLVTKSVDINYIAQAVADVNTKENIFVILASLMMIVSIGFKLSLIPFHTWTPDVYEGASAAMAGFMSIVPKIAGFVVALRLFEALIHSGVVWLDNILYAIAVLTMTLANIMALVQIDVKRMLAFSSISHAGFVLSAIVIGSTQANITLFLYWLLYAFANLGAFTMLWIMRTKQNSWHKRFEYPYEKFNGLIKTMPIAAIIMAIFMISLAGIPPFSVFWGKMYLMSAAINGGYKYLALIMAINSALALYYYLKLVVCMFLHEPIIKDENIILSNISNPLKIVIATVTILCVLSPFVVKLTISALNTFIFLSGY